MQIWASILAALLEVGLRLLERLDAARAAEFRRRVAVDGAGVLISQLNPGNSDAPSADQSATHGAERDTGRVDEQR